MALALILENKAQAAAGNDDLMDKLYFLLKHFDIPKDQFYEVEKEMGDA